MLKYTLDNPSYFGTETQLNSNSRLGGAEENPSSLGPQN